MHEARPRSFGILLRTHLALIAAFALTLPVAGVAAQGPPDAARYVLAFDAFPAERAAYGGDRVVGENEALRFLVVETRNPNALEARARGDPHVRYVLLDEEAVHASLVPNDPFYASYQYSMKPGATNMENAWDRSLGASSVKVCVIDTGQYRGHEDLSGRTYYYWKDEVNGKTTAYDDNGHGTHVTGTIAASTNNGKGLAGIAPGASIGAAKVLNHRGSGTWSQVANGITDCANAGSHVESMSLGAPGGSSLLQDAINYALARNVFIAAAAGNGGCSNCIEYPAKYAGVTAVTCSDAANKLCSFSSTGSEADLIAPGKDIPSTWPAGKNPCRKGQTSCYVLSSGTSMSTPHVAGLAALYLSTHAGAMAAATEAALKAGARDLGLTAAQQGAGLIQGAVV